MTTDPTPPSLPRVPRPTASLVLSALWFLAVALVASDAGVNIAAVILFVYGGILWGLLWLIRVSVWTHLVRHGKRPAMRGARAGIHWGSEPAVFMLTLVLVSSGALQQARFYLSYEALQSYAEDVRAGRVSEQPHGQPARSVGLYSVTETERLPNGVVRFITSPDGFDDAGFAYSLAGRPPRVGEDGYRPIRGPWWFWYRSW